MYIFSKVIGYFLQNLDQTYDKILGDTHIHISKNENDSYESHQVNIKQEGNQIYNNTREEKKEYAIQYLGRSSIIVFKMIMILMIVPIWTETYTILLKFKYANMQTL